MRTLAAAAALATLAAASPAGAQAPVPPPAQARAIEGAVLTVNAEANASTTPDIATINAGVVTDGATAEAAMAANTERMNGVMSALKKAGIAEKDIQTSTLSLNPQYVYKENEPPKLTGYQAQNTVTVKVRNLKNVGKAIDAAIAQGGNQLYGISFGVDKPDPVLDRARAEALQKARARADLYAKAAGLSVYRILAISEGGGYTPPYPVPMFARAEAMNAAPPPVAPGEVSMSANVSVTFELR